MPLANETQLEDYLAPLPQNAFRQKVLPLIRTNVVSPELLARQGLSRCFSKAAGFEMTIGGIEDGDFPFPSVLLIGLDQSMQLELLKSAGPSARKVLIVSRGNSIEVQKLVVLRGAQGLVSPECPDSVLRKAVRSIAEGELWVSRKAVAHVIAVLRDMQRVHNLTRREQEVLALVGAGRKNREIAQRLHISVETVRWHLRGIYPKIAVTDRRTAIAFAANWDLIEVSFSPQRTLSADV